ncbi:MAG: hypothetical protein FJ297_02300 [Planctomycetes bacterium]|nr:hypothetical protein [Planctomycetota bacterium]
MGGYWHRQHAPLCLVLYALAVLFLILAVQLDEEPWLNYLFAACGLLVLVCAVAFHHLTVFDDGDGLAVRFGPLPLFRARVRYATIRDVAVDRSTLLEGLGIHLSPRGWIWNLWGRDCVAIRHTAGTFRVGTDEAMALADFLRTKIPPDSASVV